MACSNTVQTSTDRFIEQIERADADLQHELYNYIREKYEKSTVAEYLKDKPLIDLMQSLVKDQKHNLLEMCLTAGADPTSVDEFGKSVLQVCLESESPSIKILELLLKHRGQSAETGFESAGRHLIVLAVRSDLPVDTMIQILKRLIDAGASLTKTHGNSTRLAISPLHEAAFNKDWTNYDDARIVFDFLVSNGADVNEEDMFHATPLQVLISAVPPPALPTEECQDELIMEIKTKKHLIKYLIDVGASVNQQNGDGRTSLHLAVLTVHTDVVEHIVSRGADVKAVSSIGYNALHDFCINLGWEEDDEIEPFFKPMINLLVDLGCDINSDSAVDKATPLHYLVTQSGVEACRILLKNGASVKARDYIGRTPLHLSARSRNPLIAQLLLDYDAGIDDLDLYGYSALHYCGMYENVGVAKVLLKNRASVYIKGNLSVFPIHLAAERGDEEMIKCLIESGADVQTEDQWKATPLHYAAGDGNKETIAALLNAKADRHALDAGGHDPLWHAQTLGYKSATVLLAEKESDITYGNIGFFRTESRAVDEIDDYYENISPTLKTLQDPAEAILSTTGVGRAFWSKESSEILSKIERHAEKLVEHIGKIDPRFEGHIVKTGSVYEGVKVGFPDEFDFMCCLDVLSALVEEDVSSFPGFVILKPKDKSIWEKDFSEFITESGHVNSWYLLRYFNQLAMRAVFNITTSGDEPQLQQGWAQSKDFQFIFNNSGIPLSQLPGQSTTWRGCEFKGLDVHVDFIPAIFIQTWPEQCIPTCTLVSENICDKGHFLVPKMQSHSTPGQNISQASPGNMWPYGAGIWRLSFSHVELDIMSSMPSNIKDGYMLAKSFLCPPMACSIRGDPAMYFQQEMDEDGNEMEELSDSNANYSEDSSSLEDVNNIDTSNTNTLQEDGQTDMNDYVTPITNETQAVSSSETSSEADSMPDIQPPAVLNIFGDYEKSDYEPSSVLPSYYLKMTLFHLLSDMKMQSVQLENVKPSFLALDIYSRLYEGLKNGKIPSFFVKDHNLIATEQHAIKKKLRHSFCNNIVSLMKALHFEDD